MMTGFSEWVSHFRKFAGNEKADLNNLVEEPKRSNIWPRLLSFSPSPQECEEDLKNPHNSAQNAETHNHGQQQAIVEEEEECEEEEDDSMMDMECDEDGNEVVRQRRGGISRKLRCICRGARFGLKEGALSGIFFGGSYGIYKYFKAQKEGGGDDSGGGQNDNESTLNDSVIFVTAANGAIAMAVFCMFFCCTKAALYCG